MARYIVYFPLGSAVPQRIKYIDDASDAPDANDDAATLGVTVGSLWLDTANGNTYVCHDASTGAAVWKQLGGIGASDSGSLFPHLSVSGATTVDRADGATHDLTLTGNATITLDGAVTGEATDWRLVIRQDGTGNRTITWADTITWVGGSAPTLQTGANAVDVIGLVTVNDGTTYLGFHAAGGGGGASALDDLTDVTITAAAEGDLLRYNGTAWVDTTLRPEPMIDSAGGVMTDGNLNPMMHEVAW